MLNKSPLNIEYPEDLKNKVYVFQVDTSTGASYRLNPKLAKDIQAVGLDVVPFLIEGQLNGEFLTS